MSSSSSERNQWQLELEKEFVPRGVDASLIAAIVHEEEQTYDGAYSVLTVLAGSSDDPTSQDASGSGSGSGSDGNSSPIEGHDTNTTTTKQSSSVDAKDEEEKVEMLLQEWKLVEKESNNMMENLHITDEEDASEEHGEGGELDRGEREGKRLGEAASRGLFDVDNVAAGEEGVTTTLSDDVLHNASEPASGLAFLIHAFPSRTPIYLEEMLNVEGGIVEQVIDTLTVMEMVENGDFDGESAEEDQYELMERDSPRSKERGLNYDILEKGTSKKKISKNDRRRRKEIMNGSNAMEGYAKGGAPKKINLTDIRQGGSSVSHPGRKVKVNDFASKRPSSPEDDATMAARLAAEERVAAGLPPQEEEEEGDVVQDNDWLFSSSILDQLSLLLDFPSHKVRSVHNTCHFNLRATTQRLINLNCIEYPTLGSLEKAGEAPSGTATTIVDGLAVLLPYKARSEVERAFRGTKGRQDATLDLIQLIDVVEKSAIGEKTDVLDPMKSSRSSGTPTVQVSSKASSQQANDGQGRFNFVGDDQVSLPPGQVPYSQITKRSIKNGGPNNFSAARQHALDQLKAGAASTSYPFHSAHIDASSSTASGGDGGVASNNASNLFEGARRNETKSEAEKLAVEYRAIAQEYRNRREQSLIQAAQAYRSLPGGGANKQLKGATAWVYADEARRLDAKARAFSLKAAQATVRHRMMTNRAYSNGLSTNASSSSSFSSSSTATRQTSDVVDLHGLTVHESLSITKEALSAWWSRSSSGSVRPLYIVTGVGRHSRGNVAVIRPAILKMLQRDGWIVSEQREGQIAVKGLR